MSVGAATATARARDIPSDPTLPVATARGLAFVALAAFGVLHWMVLLDPAEPNRALYALGAGIVAMFGMLAAARLEPRAAQAAAVGVLVVTLGLALLGGGIADELLRPDRWGELASGISRGIESLPGVRVPYRGVDEWTRTVIPLGGTVLVTLAAALAFWPRRNGRTGFPGAALVPARRAVRDPGRRARLRERVPARRRARAARPRVPAAREAARRRRQQRRSGRRRRRGAGADARARARRATSRGGTTRAGRSTPPRRVRRRSRGITTTAHSTGRATVASCCACACSGAPRTGRRRTSTAFDGARWVHTRSEFEDPATPNDAEAIETGTQRIRVTIRNLASDDFVTAGWADEVDSPTLRETPRGDGTWTASRTLRRGDAYEASRLHAADRRRSSARRPGRRPSVPTWPRSGGCC